MAKQQPALLQDSPSYGNYPGSGAGQQSAGGGMASTLLDAGRLVVESLASLKLTVVLFAVSILLVLFGTLAQAEPGMDIWRVIEQYFRTPVAKVELKIFTPKAFFPHTTPAQGWFPFPGGTLIGALMGINLLAAYATRFRIQARGMRLWMGLAMTALGALVTAMVIASGGTSDSGIQDQPFVDWNTLWRIFQVMLGAVGVLSGVGAVMLDSRRKIERVLLWILAASLGGTLIWTLWQGDGSRLSDPSMRILWQLLKGQFAATVLLVGCILLFQKRGGVVLLHSGIGLLMLSELLVAWTAVESQMTIFEGESSNYAQDIRYAELAVVHSGRTEMEHTGMLDAGALVGTSGTGAVELQSDFDDEVVIPGSRLVPGERISSDLLPFDIEVKQYFQNSSVAQISPEDKQNPADSGTGRQFKLVELRPGAGTDTGGQIDVPGAYATFYDKKTGKPIGTYLLSGLLSLQTPPMPEKVPYDGKEYELFLRFQRYYKPYTIEAIDVRRENYMGTETARDYSSLVRVHHPDQPQPLEVKIWMNNPLRAYGETFYQSGHNVDPDTGREITTLQVVNNVGWMIPYVCCMIVATGMFYQFGVVLLRFLRRRSAPETLAKWGAGASLMMGDPSGLAGALGHKAFTAAKAKSSTSSSASAQPAAGEPASDDEAESTEPASKPHRVLNWALPAGVLAVFLLLAAYLGKPPKSGPDQIDYYQAGKIPIVYEGRMKPLDTIARNSLLILSDSESFALYDVVVGDLGNNRDAAEVAIRKAGGEVPAEQGSGSQVVLHDAPSYKAIALAEQLYGLNVNAKAKRRRQLATRWLMDLMTRPEVAAEYPVFRIENLELIDKLGLERREGLRYAYSEFEERIQQLQGEIADAQALQAEQLTTYQRKLLELERKRQLFFKLHASFNVQKPSTTDEVRRFMALLTQLDRSQPPLSVPPFEGTMQLQVSGAAGGASAGTSQFVSSSWEVLPKAWLENAVRAMEKQPVNPYYESLAALLDGYRESFDAQPSSGTEISLQTKFNNDVAAYLNRINEHPLVEPYANKVAFESYFNSASPFFYMAGFYLVAFVLTALSWLGWSTALNRAALWLIVLTLLIHTFALVGRIYISGRPPVTNLYSSAVFIGWGMVVLGLVIEGMFKLGIGNILGSVSGFITLGIAHFLAGDGDTFVVLVAVLDTQFWLATHVTCITLGYATTYLAGFIGLIYILRGVLTPTLTPKVERELYRMTYGTLCFSLFFSFVGTVLGGLWADDSWGRFWGWDPKENGALIIVLWNALVLHARWDGMIKERGTAVLSVAGMIFVSWSWFGVNELGAGLHSYGFTEGVLLALSVAWAAMLGFIGMGCLPRHLWWSFNRRELEKLAAQQGAKRR